MTFLNSEYILKTDNNNLPLNTTEVNEHLKENFTDIEDEDYLVVLIKAVEKFGEDFTKRTFLTKTYTNYRTGWESSYEIRKATLQSIVSVKYIDEDDVTQTVSSSNYNLTYASGFRYLYFDSEYLYPNLTSNNPQPIIIEFTAGYGSSETSIPQKIKTAMLHHLARIWLHRGDCPDEVANLENFLMRALPTTSKMLYMSEKILELGFGC